MITGTVTPDREAVLRLAVYDISAQPHDTDAIVDTGFTGWLTLPSDVIAANGLIWRRLARAILADGSVIVTNIYEATILWDGQPVTISVSDGAEPLVGMSLMYGYELVMPIVDGGTFTLRRLAAP